MYEITEKRELNESVTLIKVKAPFIAAKALPGQFIIYRVDEYGERVPLTIADYDREEGTVTVILQKIGRTTKLLAEKNPGDFICDFVGPLGIPSHLDGFRKVAVVGGGVGCAIAYPQAKMLHSLGCDVDIIAGFRSKDIVILEQEMKDASSRLFITTDDGSYGEKGLVTNVLDRLISEGNNYDAVIAIGPVIMMKFVASVTKPHNIKTFVSLNPIMIDGTGMCGCCRVTVDGKIKFACVDGPDFDGHLVDFEELMKRNSFYKEREAHDSDHKCRLEGLRDA